MNNWVTTDRGHSNRLNSMTRGQKSTSMHFVYRIFSMFIGLNLALTREGKAPVSIFSFCAAMTDGFLTSEASPSSVFANFVCEQASVNNLPLLHSVIEQVILMSFVQGDQN